MPLLYFASKQTWPTVTDDIRISVYNPLDTNTPIASIQKNAPHIDQQFDFFGLPRQNFIYKVLQTEINGSTVIAQLGDASFVAANDELSYKKPILIKVGVDFIPGTETVWPAGVNSVTVGDWIGQEFEAFGRPGQYPFKRDEVNQVDASWTSSSGLLALNTVDDVFQFEEYLYFEFQPIIQQSSGGVAPSASGGGWSEIKLVTTNTTLLVNDVGKKILLEPAGNFITITLPDNTTAEANKITWFEMVNSAAKCAQIVAASGQTIAWIDTEIDICPGETFELYKRIVSAGVYEWRVQNPVGNFFTVGDWVANDKGYGNLIYSDGSGLHYQQYWRLYRYMLGLGNAITYATWDANNPMLRTKFSLKDTAGNNFRIPDVRRVFERPLSTEAAGDFAANTIIAHAHDKAAYTNNPSRYGQFTNTVRRGMYTGTDDAGLSEITGLPLVFNSALGLWLLSYGTETAPDHRFTKKYLRF